MLGTLTSSEHLLKHGLEKKEEIMEQPYEFIEKTHRRRGMDWNGTLATIRAAKTYQWPLCATIDRITCCCLLTCSPNFFACFLRASITTARSRADREENRNDYLPKVFLTFFSGPLKTVTTVRSANSLVFRRFSPHSAAHPSLISDGWTVDRELDALAGSRILEAQRPAGTSSDSMWYCNVNFQYNDR